MLAHRHRAMPQWHLQHHIKHNMIVHSCNPRTLVMEVGGSGVQHRPFSQFDVRQKPHEILPQKENQLDLYR